MLKYHPNYRLAISFSFSRPLFYILARNMGTRNDIKVERQHPKKSIVPRGNSQSIWILLHGLVILAMPLLESRSRRSCCCHLGILAYFWFCTRLIELYNFIFSCNISLKCLLRPFVRCIGAVHVGFALSSLLRSRSLKIWSEVSLHISFWNRLLGNQLLIHLHGIDGEEALDL